MKPQELRIGNWVNTPYGNVQVKDIVRNEANVYHIMYDVDGKERPCRLSKLSPIELTDDVLERIEGFDVEDRFVHCTFSTPAITYNKERKVWSFYWDDEDQIQFEEIALHTLQNIVFDLTGNDLTIKL